MKETKGNRIKIVNLFLILGVLVMLFITVRTPGAMAEDYSPGLYATAWSLLPPLVAIALALITKEVYSSLFAGVVVGAALYSGGNLELMLNTMLYHEGAGLVPSISDLSHSSILTFVVILAAVTELMNRSGSAAAFGRWAVSRIRGRVGAQLSTVLLGVLIFVDDGFNCMTVGSVMRPITDRYQVSRAKLAYIIDATAAPVCIIAPVSSWAAAVSYAVPESMNINGFRMFLQAIPYNLYALGTLLMLILITVWGVDFGLMRKHEENAKAGDLFTTGERPAGEDMILADDEHSRVSNLVIPVVVLIVSCIVLMLYTGGFFEGAGVIEAFSNTDSARALVAGSLITLLVTYFLYMGRGVLSFSDFVEALPVGFRTMCAPMLILVLAWNLSGMTGLLGAADFIHDLMSRSAGSLTMFLPCIIFLVSVFLAFSTGTSWGTFSILIPIVCGVFPDAGEMLVISISACLAGSVCGDHCSPISDTTIMSSAGARCDHLNHVSTQLPYAITVAAVSAVGYLLAGILGYMTGGKMALIATPVTLLILVCVILVIRRREIQ